MTLHQKGTKAYGAVTIVNKVDLVENLLCYRIDSLSKSDSLEARNEILARRRPDTLTFLPRLAARRQALADAIRKTKEDLYLLKYHNRDTSMAYFSRFLYLKKKDLFSAIQADSGWTGDSVKYVSGYLVDTCRLLTRSPHIYPAKFKLLQDKKIKMMDFIAEYPTFGFWIVLSIAQMILWFILFPIIGANLLGLKETLGPNYYQISSFSRIVNFFLPLIFVGAFCIAFYYLLADNYIIPDHYFFSEYNRRMLIYATPGYLVAVYCFNSYLTLANHFQTMDEDADKNPALLADPVFAARFHSLKSAFNNTFTFSAIVLSIMIIWAGVLIYALNETDALRFYAVSAGIPFIPGDYVYLIGMLHTVILLTFFIPVRLQFSNMKITSPEAMTAAGQTPGKLEGILSTIGGLIATTSPLVASLLPNLLQLIFD